MNRQKAAKDMTAPELVSHLIDRLHEVGVDSFTEEDLIYELTRPAPNPFTPDQLAWMREAQRDGYAYAAMNKSSNVLVYAEKPYKQDDYWVNADNRQNYNAPRFFKQYTSWDDTEPLCFADYAPIKEDEGNNAT